MSGWTLAWIAWALFFLAVEGRALVNKTPGDTLSEHVWKWFHVRDSRPTVVVAIARTVLALFLAWLLVHLTLGTMTPTHPLPW